MKRISEGGLFPSSCYCWEVSMSNIGYCNLFFKISCQYYLENIDISLVMVENRKFPHLTLAIVAYFSNYTVD